MKIEIVEDSKFQFKRVDPIPTQEEVDKFYAKEFYDANAEYFNNSALLLQQEQSDFFNSRWKAIYEQLILFLEVKFEKNLSLTLALVLRKHSYI